MIVGCAHQCARTVEHTLKRMESVASAYARHVVILVENDSTDGTKGILRAWVAASSGRILIECDGLFALDLARTMRIAEARNRYLRHIGSSPDLQDYDELVVFDMDGVNDGGPSARAVHAASEWLWSRRNIQGVFANSRPVYYDIWPLRHPTWSPDDCWHRVAEALGDKREAIERFVFARQRSIGEKEEPIIVDSAFGGFGMYKMKAVLGATYEGVDGSGMAICEHVAFNRQVSRGGAGAFAILPWLTNDTPPEHVKVERKADSASSSILIGTLRSLFRRSR